MTVTKRSDMIVPEVLAESIKGAFQGMKALAGTGIAVVATGLPGSVSGGDKVKIPYFGTLGELDDLAAEGDALVPAALTTSSEEAEVQHSGKAFEATKWARMAAQDDPYVEAGRQFREMLERRADQALIDAAKASGLPATMVKDVFDAGSPAKLNYARVVAGKMAFGDEQAAIAGLVLHSKTFGDLLLELDVDLRPMLTMPNDGSLARLAGIPLIVSDRMPVDFPVVATGTTPPTVTISGHPLDTFPSVTIDITTGGARGTAVFRYSLDGKTTWAESSITTAASVVLGSTGLTANFATGTYNVDNEYVATAKYTSLICKARSLAFWLNDSPDVLADKDILSNNDLAAVHVYWAAHRYKRMAGGTRPGIVKLVHN
jgi:hypothetical protein